jgi:signal transduction histidine kinase
MIKLLDKPLKAFTTYAMVVLLCSIPVYFVIIDLIWVHEINKHNKIVANSTKQNLAILSNEQSKIDSVIGLWNRLQPETEIIPVKALKNDSTYNVYRKDEYTTDGGYDRFQGLVTYFKINEKPYSLTVEANVEESYETIIAITAITVLFFIILLVGFIKLNKSISKKLWSPFYKTLDQIKSFHLTDQRPIEFEHNNVLEFQELNTSISKLVEGNLAAFKRQKEFTENASHELQTPLAIVQAKLDLLLQDVGINTAQSKIIEDTNNALSRVSRINKNLLLLAKIENHQFLKTQTVDMSERLQTMLEFLDDLLEARKVEVNIQSNCLVEANPVLAEIMLTNLLMNSIRHTSINGKVEIFLSMTKLIVSNNGLGSLDVEKLFRRFSSASIQTPGSGLGLSIVKEICEQHGWEVSYNFSESMHRFSVNFKI